MNNKLHEKMKNGELTADQSFIISQVFADQINKWIEKEEKELPETELDKETDKRIWDKIQQGKKKSLPDKLTKRFKK